MVADLGHIAKQSGCKAVVDLNALPLSEAFKANTTAEQVLSLALGGGEDYELCFTVHPSAMGILETAMAHSGTSFCRIGQMAAGEGVELTKDNKIIDLNIKGFTHF